MPESAEGYGRIVRMPTASRPLRLIVFAVLALAAAAVLWAVFGALRSGIALWNELCDLPAWLHVVVVILIASVVAALLFFAWRLFGPRRRKVMPTAAPTRADIDLRLIALRDRKTDTAALQSELEELDRRARSEELYVAVFGEISAGKSSLIRALSNDASPHVDVIGGTTRAVSHYRGLLDGQPLTLADVPGSHEVGGVAREQIARDEALRAHVVLYVCTGDLTRDQDAELKWLRGFGKPIVLALNKADQFDDAERHELQRTLRERYRALTDAQIIASTGGSERFERQLADGRRELVQRDRLPDIEPLRLLLSTLAARGAGALEASRAAAVLTQVSDRTNALESSARERDAEAIVAKYTKRAVVGAMAAVMPGSDIVIQGVLATALIRELGKRYDVSVRDVDIDAFLSQVKLTVRTSTSLVLAIAGNAMKAFPGLGTLGGGVLHAIAYGLIFDSLGRAVATTMRDQHKLDASAAATAMSSLLSSASAARMRRIAEMALHRNSADESD